MSKLQTGKLYYFNFAGSKLIGRYYKKEKLIDGSTVYMFESKDGYKYPVDIKNIKIK
jgi:hypothetical protein